MEVNQFINTLMSIIAERPKMKSRLYQVIMAGDATQRLLQNFVIHRYPIKNLWVRHIMHIGSHMAESDLRRLLLENAYEEETGDETDSARHVNTFLDFGETVGVSAETVMNAPIMPETRALMDHNLNACNNCNVHFTEGATSVLLLMEGQPPIVNKTGRSMESVMRDVYELPKKGYEFFTHHASSGADAARVSVLEDKHTEAIVQVLKRCCNTPRLQENAINSLKRAIDLRHKHFDMIYDRYYDPSEPVFRYSKQMAAA